MALMSYMGLNGTAQWLLKNRDYTNYDQSSA